MSLSALSLLLLSPALLPAQDATPPAARIVIQPPSLELQVGETATLEASVIGADGQTLDEEVFFFSRARRSVTIDREGKVEAVAPGQFTIVARTRRRGATAEGQEGRISLGERLTAEVSVTVLPPPLVELTVIAPEGRLFAGTEVDLQVRGTDDRGAERAVPGLSIASSDRSVAEFNSFGQLELRGPGRFTATAEAEGVKTSLGMQVHANPVASLDLLVDSEEARTGDVLHFAPFARNRHGSPVTDVPVTLSFTARLDDDLGPAASGQIEPDGRFVAETPGIYTIVATCGSNTARKSVHIVPRNVGGKLKLVGRGKVYDTHTSDLWIWEGLDGRDYAVTGTWGANGDAIFWDVTDPANIERIATVNVDARTVNDVKVTPDGRLCVLSREGASNRKNGVVLVDVSNPREPEVLTSYDEALTGGVHNVFADGNTIYALSAGRRYDVIDAADPRSPRTIGTFELDTPSHSIHDVWVEDGLAYSSNWSNGVHIVDVGAGLKGGSPSNPQPVASYAYPSGWNHAAFPYRSKETGRFYVVAGDEAFPFGLHTEGLPTYPRGWFHFIDFTDLEAPREVARYQVPEAGTHNLWIEGDVLYGAYYNGGLRVVDISGELMGDLYRQGREIAFFLSADPEGHIANAPMVWGPQPYKGNIFFSDWNSGLWCVRLEQDGKN